MDNAIIPQMIKAMWPVISEYIQQKTIDDLEMLANKQLTRIPMFDNFTFKNSNLGTESPRLSNFVLIDTSGPSIVIEVDVEYDGNCYFDMEVDTVFGTIPMSLDEVKFSGSMRLELADLIPILPFVSAGLVYFVNPPVIDFNLTKAANIADFSPIAKKVRKLLADAVAAQIVSPNRIVIPLAVKDTSIYRSVTLVAILAYKMGNYCIVSF